MLVSSIALLVALVAVYISLKSTEEIKWLGAVLTATICILLDLIFAPWSLKLLVVGVVWIGVKYLSSIIGRYISSSVE